MTIVVVQIQCIAIPYICRRNNTIMGLDSFISKGVLLDNQANTTLKVALKAGFSAGECIGEFLGNLIDKGVDCIDIKRKEIWQKRQKKY